jgi:RNA polymerase-binding transcription factor DksA
MQVVQFLHNVRCEDAAFGLKRTPARRPNCRVQDDAQASAALRRIEDGTYGYCEETGEPISIKRLDARPIATLSIEAQERRERFDRFYCDE